MTSAGAGKLNELGERMLLSGDPARAHELLEQAVKSDAATASMWINLAAALRGLKRRDEEMQALQRALTLEPNNLRAMLQKGSLHELQNDTRGAAYTYRMALRAIPPGTRVPPGTNELLAHASKVVEANNRALESFLEERLTALRTEYAEAPLHRFDRCLSILLQRKRVYQQQPSFLFFPQLPAIEFHEDRKSVV